MTWMNFFWVEKKKIAEVCKLEFFLLGSALASHQNSRVSTGDSITYAVTP